ncbi:MAG: hypothetical protein M3Q81_01195 [bacterium]|nr:hypothetical protein [bacterium]
MRKSFNRRNVLISLILLLIWLAASWSLLHKGFFFIHDYVHAARVAEMLRGVEDGQLPVRWSQHFGYGYGMPLFQFYAPLPYAVGAFFYWLGLDIILVLKLLFALANILTILGAYYLGKRLYTPLAGLVVATAITLAPYRAVNLYVRGALSEIWGIMAMPWILLGIYLVIHQKRWGWLLLTLSIMALVLSHNLMTLVFLPLSVIFGLGVLLQKWLPQRINYRQLAGEVGQLAGSYLLAIGSTVFFTVPALAEKDYTKIGSILGGYFDFHLHFLYLRQLITPYWGYGGSAWGPDDGISFFLGAGQLLGTAAVAVMLIFSIWRSQSAKKHSVASSLGQWIISNAAILVTLILLLYSLLMTTEKSVLLWDNIELFSYIQFPWRWLASAVVFLGLGLGWLVTQFSSSRNQVLATGVLILIIVIGNTYYFRPERYLDRAEGLYYSDAGRIQGEMSSVLPDFIPQQVPDTLVEPPSSRFETIPKAEVLPSILVDKSHQLLIQGSFVSPTTVTFSVADFPGWQTYLDAEPVQKTTTALGLISVEVPEGAHTVGLRLEQTAVRSLSDSISAVSLLLLGGLIIRQSSYRRSTLPVTKKA